MKKKSILFLLALLTFSCSQENDKVQNEKQNLELSLKNGIVQIDYEEIPSLSNEQSRRLGFVNIKNDDNRPSFLNTKKNVLSVPFDKKMSLISTNRGPVIGLCIKIKIARLNPNSNCSGGCIECIGFRCDFITFPCLIKRNPIETNPRDREQVAEVIVNETEGTLEYHFLNEIDWEYLANN